MTVDILRFISIFFGSLLAGSMVMELFMIIPVMRSISPSAVVEVHKGLSPLGFRYVPTVGTIAGVAGIAIVIIEGDFSDASTILTAVGVVSLLTGLAITGRLYLPIDRTMKSWSTERVADDYSQVLERWHRVHIARTAMYTLGVSCFIVAALSG